MPLAGAPRDLYTQLLACSSSQSVVAIASSVPGGGRSQGCRGYLLLMLEHARLHQLCRHQCPSSSIGDGFKWYFTPFFWHFLEKRFGLSQFVKPVFNGQSM